MPNGHIGPDEGEDARSCLFSVNVVESNLVRKVDLFEFGKGPTHFVGPQGDDGLPPTLPPLPTLLPFKPLPTLLSFEDLPPEVVSVIASHLNHAEAFRLTSISRQLAQAGEFVFQKVCQKNSWAFPRRPRGDDLSTRIYKWRALYRKHACRSCGCKGEFGVRKMPDAAGVIPGGHLLFLLCQPCAAENENVRKRLVADNLSIDLEGISGKKLKTTCDRKRGRDGSPILKLCAGALREFSHGLGGGGGMGNLI